MMQFGLKSEVFTLVECTLNCLENMNELEIQILYLLYLYLLSLMTIAKRARERMQTNGSILVLIIRFTAEIPIPRNHFYFWTQMTRYGIE